MINQDTIESLKNFPPWQELEKHILSEVERLDRVSDIAANDPQAIATEALARVRAIALLRDVLKPFGFAIAPQIDRTADTLSRTGLDDE